MTGFREVTSAASKQLRMYLRDILAVDAPDFNVRSLFYVLCRCSLSYQISQVHFHCSVFRAHIVRDAGLIQTRQIECAELRQSRTEKNHPSILQIAQSQ